MVGQHTTDDPQKLEEGLWQVAQRDVRNLVIKNTSYGASWRKRGGIGAFMMLARKWDRIENLLQNPPMSAPTVQGPAGPEFAMYDIFGAIDHDPSAGGILDDIRDLRCYLMLVEEYMARSGVVDLTNLGDKEATEVAANIVKTVEVDDDPDGDPFVPAEFRSR